MICTALNILLMTIHVPHHWAMSMVIGSTESCVMVFLTPTSPRRSPLSNLKTRIIVPHRSLIFLRNAKRPKILTPLSLTRESTSVYDAYSRNRYDIRPTRLSGSSTSAINDIVWHGKRCLPFMENLAKNFWIRIKWCANGFINPISC